VRRVFEEGRGAYGCRRVAAQLNRDGHPCSVDLIADLMRELVGVCTSHGPTSAPRFLGRSR